MARETKEQRQEREAKAAEQRRLDREAFLSTVPKRLMDAQALANTLGVDTSVSLTEKGPLVQFRNKSQPWIEVHLGYDCEEWSLESLESDLEMMKKEQDEAAARFQTAKEAFARLTPFERQYIKEFINQLPY